MSGCEFTDNINILTGNPCLETMMNENENINDEYTRNMDYLEKGYLFAVTILFVGILYKASNRFVVE